MNTVTLTTLCQLMCIWVSAVTGLSAALPERSRRETNDFHISQLLGEWYDIGRTTYIWGPANTWTSQQWNFVQGEDSTVVALFNGMCKTCSHCSETSVFRVRQKPEGDFLLEGNGQKFLIRVELNLKSELIVVMCFLNGEQTYTGQCPKSKFQVSVLSQQPRMEDVNRWQKIVSQLPVDIEDIDSSSRVGCPRQFIDSKLVREDLVTSAEATIINVIGFDSSLSTVVLPCSLGQYAGSFGENSKVIWTQELSYSDLAVNETVWENTDHLRVLHFTPEQFDLLLHGVSPKDSDIYRCYLDTGESRITLSRVAVSSADFLAGPSIVYHSSNVTARRGNTAVMECYVSGNPPAYISWWMKTSGQSEAYVQTGKGDTRMVIDNVQAEDEGIYKCEASNGISSPVAALINLQVEFSPETETSVSMVSVPFSGKLELTCHVLIKSADTITWQVNGIDIQPDDRHFISLIQTVKYHYDLRLVVAVMGKKDFGQYACVARDRLGVSVSSVEVTETQLAGEQCQVNNIPVMKNFSVQQFLGDMERMQTTRFFWGSDTFESEVQGFFITLRGSLVQYYRGFSPVKKHCLAPGTHSLVRLDTPGDYLVYFDGKRGKVGRGRFKIVYTDYTHAVMYMCMSGDDQETCPLHLVHVQIMSRLPHIPEDVLQLLYGFVQQTCIPVTSLVDTVPGICKMPPDFMYSNGWIGNYPEASCQVANLPVQMEMTADLMAGDWHLVAEVLPQDYSALPRNLLHIVLTAEHLILFYRGIRSGFCSATEADALFKSEAPGSYYFDHNGLTVDSRVLYVDDGSLVLYTCLALHHDGTCYKGSARVELYHRKLHIDNFSMLWMIRAVAMACVDIKRLERLHPTVACPIPENILTAATADLVDSDHIQIGCHRNLITLAEDFTENKFTGKWLVMYRNTEGVPDDFSNTGQFSETYHVVKNTDGGLLLLRRRFQSDWSSCPPTRTLELQQNNGPGEYVHRLPTGTVLFKVLSLSEDTAVVYWCHSLAPNGVCQQKNLTVEILARSPETQISKKRLHIMKQHIVNVCVKLENLLFTSQTEKCSIPEDILGMAEAGEFTAVYDVPVLTCKHQVLKGVADLNVEQITGEWMVLWRNENHGGKRAPYAESAFIILTENGLLYLWRSFNNELGRCNPEEAGKFTMTSGTGDYYSEFNKEPVAMKILQAINSSMLVMWCYLDDSSHCLPHRTTVQILSRRANLDNATRDILLETLESLCLNDVEWVPSEPGMCQIEADVLTAAYIDGINTEYSRIGCRVDLIMGQAGVTDDMIIGSWSSVYQSELTAHDGAAASVAFHFTKMSDGPLSLLFRLYSSQEGECLPARVMELSRSNSSSGATFELKYCESTSPYGYMYVLYADGNYLTVLLCHLQENNMCDPRSQILLLLHKEGSSLQANLSLLNTVKELAADVCVDYQLLVEPTLKPCPVQEEILADIAKGELQTCANESEVQCYPQYIQVHQGFDVREFTGTWYSIEDSACEEWRDGQPVGSATYHFMLKDNDTVMMLYTAASSQVQCRPTELRLLQDVGKGHFIFTYNNSQAVLKIVWMDENYTVTYWCLNADESSPWCQHPAHVVILSRQQPAETNTSLPAYLQSIVVDACIPSQRMCISALEVCEIPSNIILTLEEDAIETSFSVIQCALQFVSTMDDFDMYQFLGEWHTVRLSKPAENNNTWESLIQSFVLRDNGTAFMAFTGHSPAEDRCMPMEVHTLLLSSHQTGQWTYSSGDSSVTVKVIWTDYNSTALLYTCGGQVGEDGLCQGASLQVEILSRYPYFSPSAESEILSRLPNLCVQKEDFHDIRTGLCNITSDLKHLVGSERAGGNESVASCRVQDIPLEQNFTLPQMKGVWYEIARTRFTFNQMESVISVYKYNPEKDLLDGLFIGTLHKHCQSPLKSVTRKKIADGVDAIIEGRIQTGESIFPWITFSIIYFDGDAMLHMACYLQNEDGTCPRDKTEVTLLGRTRQLTPEMDKKLEGLMKSVCLSREDLVPTKETADCMPLLTNSKKDTAGLPDTTSCQLNDVPVVENLNEKDMIGTWYGLGSADYGTKAESSGFVVSISRNTEHTMQWRHWNIRNGSCQAEKAVYMKAACTGSKNGDYISTRSSSFMFQWTTVKILQFQDNLMLVYICTQETFEGTCKPEGILIYLLGRAANVSLNVIIPLLKSLRSVCVNPENMKFVLSTVRCNHVKSAVQIRNTSRCAVDKLPAVHIDMEKLSGIWYEMAHTVDVMFPLTKAVLAYQALPNNQMAMYLAAEDPSGQCQGPLQGRMKQRCHSNPGPETLGRLKFPGIWSWAPWRVLHVNYTTSLIALSCMDEQRDGSCSFQGVKIHFLSRNSHPGADLRQHLHNTFKQLGCFDHLPIANVYHEGPSCQHKLDPVLASAA